MPYNNNPIAPNKEVTGTVALPLARVKKIIAHDPDISACANNSAFLITAATELFLQHLVGQAHAIAKAERKPRRNIQYRDVANAVARVENLEFLADVVPKTMTMRQAKAKVAADTQSRQARTGVTVNGQVQGGPMDRHVRQPQERNRAAQEDVDMTEEDEEGHIIVPPSSKPSPTAIGSITNGKGKGRATGAADTSMGGTA